MIVYCVNIGDNPEWPDPFDNFAEMASWARECCVSYKDFTVTDTSDINQWDYVAAFVFEKYEDSIAFRLRWKAT